MRRSCGEDVRRPRRSWLGVLRGVWTHERHPRRRRFGDLLVVARILVLRARGVEAFWPRCARRMELHVVTLGSRRLTLVDVRGRMCSRLSVLLAPMCKIRGAPTRAP